ncbi:MAG: hypothetical protein ACR2QW_10860 [bacterium]
MRANEFGREIHDLAVAGDKIELADDVIEGAVLLQLHGHVYMQISIAPFVKFSTKSSMAMSRT